ncbi:MULTISPECIES: hypothetical protein [Rahnella]|uniref:Uncharacterized protein n=1 Tax=Rahnella laticis TaxID=2787622 RepID=A0ABS0ECL9_9GAMM|nr:MULTISPECIES: hypothetical protein [Rahnella]MBF7982828.1 hypothetical protein [Rahnella laticis]MBF8002939.1 hypothetical protein [Rahnella sp. LAC-M12]
MCKNTPSHLVVEPMSRLFLSVHPIKIIHSASLGDFCTENVLLLHQRSLIGVFFLANTDLTAFFVGSIFAAFYADALFLKGGLQ